MKRHPDNFNRYLVTGILFLASLIVQVNLVYACQVIEQQPTSSCCCDEMPSSNGCPTKDISNDGFQYSSGACCQVNIDVSAKEKLSNTNAASSGKYEHKPIQPPSLKLPVFDPVLFEPGANQYFAANHRSIHAKGSDTYLITQRFRE